MIFVSTMFGSINVLASEPPLKDDIISSQTYVNALISKYNEYGVELIVTSVEENYVFTQTLLDSEIDKIEKLFSSSSENQFKLIDNTIKSNNYTSQPISNNLIIMSYMPGTVTLNNNIFVFHDSGLPLVPFTATVNVSAVISVDYQYDTITGGSSPSLSVTSGSGFADYIMLKSYSTITNNSSSITSRNITYVINAEMKTEVSIGGIVSWTKIEKILTTTFYPFK